MDEDNSFRMKNYDNKESVMYQKNIDLIILKNNVYADKMITNDRPTNFEL